MLSLLPEVVMCRCIRPRLSVWSHPHRFGTLSSHLLCTFMSHARLDIRLDHHRLPLFSHVIVNRSTISCVCRRDMCSIIVNSILESSSVTSNSNNRSWSCLAGGIILQYVTRNSLYYAIWRKYSQYYYKYFYSFVVSDKLNHFEILEDSEDLSRAQLRLHCMYVHVDTVIDAFGRLKINKLIIFRK